MKQWKCSGERNCVECKRSERCEVKSEDRPSSCVVTGWAVTWNVVEQKENLPTLTTDVFDRPDCPAWAEYAAVDENGTWYYYASEPHPGVNVWCAICKMSRGAGRVSALDWKHSLIKRPVKTWYDYGTIAGVPYDASYEFVGCNGISISVGKTAATESACVNTQTVGAGDNVTFKVGDKVVVTDLACEYHGQKGVILSVTSQGSCKVHLYDVDDELWFSDMVLELYKKHTFNVGDAVRVKMSANLRMSGKKGLVHSRSGEGFTVCFVGEVSGVYQPDQLEYAELTDDVYGIYEKRYDVTPDWCVLGALAWVGGRYGKIQYIAIDQIHIDCIDSSVGIVSGATKYARQARLRPWTNEELKRKIGKLFEFNGAYGLAISCDAGYITIGTTVLSSKDLHDRGDTCDGLPCGVFEHLEAGVWVH